LSIKGETRLPKLLLAISLASVALSGCSLLPKEEEVLKPPLVKPAKEHYELYEVKRGPIIKQVKGTAVFESTTVVYHEFKVAGKVTEVKVNSGDTVKKGDVLVQLDIDGLEITLKERLRDLEKAKLSLAQAKESRDPSLMKVRLLEMEIAESRLAEAELQMESKRLKAEADGLIIAMETLKAGDVVQLSKSYITVADPSELRLSYTGTSTNDLSEVQVGMEAEIGYSGKKWKGKVVQTPSTAPKTENKQLADKYNRTLYVEPKEPLEGIRVGATADIVITTQKKDQVLKIPTKGLGTFLGRNFVKVLDGESIREMDIEKGIESGSEVEIVKGLKEGQKVILQY